MLPISTPDSKTQLALPHWVDRVPTWSKAMCDFCLCGFITGKCVIFPLDLRRMDSRFLIGLSPSATTVCLLGLLGAWEPAVGESSLPFPPPMPYFFYIWAQYLFKFFFFNVDHFKVFVELVQYCFCLMFWLFGLKAYRILTPWPGVEPSALH